VDLTAYCYFPDDEQPNSFSHTALKLKPTIVFFHGGHWDVSMVTQFSPHAMHFAKRGMVAIVVEYRVASLHDTSPDDAFTDAQTVMQWLRYNHKELGVDPNRIVAAGAASGAHMALSLSMRKRLPEIDGYNPRPQAVIGVSSIVNVNRRITDFKRFPNAKQTAKNNPINNIRRKLVPSLLVHGIADTVAPHYLVADLVRMMKRKRNQCELIDFDACNHSFFNFNISPKHFEITLNSMDSFISDLGYIEPMDYL